MQHQTALQQSVQHQLEESNLSEHLSQFNDSEKQTPIFFFHSIAKTANLKITALLTYNLHTIPFTYLTYTIQ